MSASAEHVYRTLEDRSTFFRGLFDLKGGTHHKFEHWLAMLAPYLCRSLIVDQSELSKIETEQEAFTGNPCGKLRDLYPGSQLKVALEGLSTKVTQYLPFEEPLAGSADLGGLDLEDVFGILYSVDSKAHYYLEHTTRLLVFLEARTEDRLGVTSASPPALPFTTFLSQRATWHLAPDLVFPDSTPYALAENLYHEALHQSLTFLLLSEPIFLDPFTPAVWPKVDIPWRGCKWELDRVLHAAFVYHNLIDLRQRAADSKDQIGERERHIVGQSIDRARQVHRYLVSQLRHQAAYLTLQGNELIEMLAA